MGKRGKSLAIGLMGLGAAIADSGSVFGSGFQLRENSAAALGNAFAGAAASIEDPSIVANNPAGMTALRGNQVSGDLTVVIPSAIFSGMGLNATRQPIGGGRGGNGGGARPVPAAYGVYDASPDLKIRVGGHLPVRSRLAI